MSRETAIWGVFLVYLAALLGLAIAARRSGGNLSGYFIGDKKLPGWALAFSANATGESGWLLLGLTGMGYMVGAQAFWIVAGELVGLSLSWRLLARRLRQQTEAHGSITVPDYLDSRFPTHGRALRLASVVIILSMVIAYTAAQVVATGKAFSSFTSLDYRTGAVLGAAIALTYTIIGGFKAVVYTDVLQGLAMLAGLIVLPIAGVAAVGGWEALIAGLAAADPVLLAPLGPQGCSTAGLVAVVSALAVGLPFIGVPQLLVRYMAIRDPREIRQAAIISVLCILAFDIGAVVSGMAGRVLFPGLDDPETIMPVMSNALFSPVVTGLFVTVVLAAIMSTVDSLVILASSAVVRDLIEKLWRVSAGGAQLSLWAKGVTLLIGLSATAIALTESRAIYWFVLFAWSGLGAAFGPPVLCALYWRRMTGAGALAGMLGGFTTTILWVLLFKDQWHGLYEAVPGFLVGFVLVVAVSLARPEDRTD